MKDFSYELKYHAGVYGCEIDCEVKDFGQVVDLAVKIFDEFKKKMPLPERTREWIEENLFGGKLVVFRQESLSMIFQHSAFLGRKLTVMSYNPIYEVIETVLGKPQS